MRTFPFLLLSVAACSSDPVPPSATAEPGDVPSEEVPSEEVPPSQDVDAGSIREAGSDSEPSTSTLNVHVVLSGSGKGKVEVTINGGKTLCASSCDFKVAAGKRVTAKAVGVDEFTVLSSKKGPCEAGGQALACSVTVQSEATIEYAFDREPSPVLPTQAYPSSSSVYRLRNATDMAGAHYALLNVGAPYAIDAASLGASDNHAVVKWNPDGSLAWLKGVKAAELHALAVDAASGDLWFGGRCESTDVLGSSAVGTKGICYAHWTSAGLHVASYGVAANGVILDMAAAAGQVVFAGSFFGSITAGGQTLTTSSGDLFAARASAATSTIDWFRKYGGASLEDFGVRVAASPDGRFAIGGTIRGNGSADGVPISEAAFLWSGFVSLYSQTGARLGTTQLSAGPLELQALSFQGSNLLVAGRYGGGAPYFGSGYRVTRGLERELFVAQLDGTSLQVVGGVGSNAFYGTEIYNVHATPDGGFLVLADFNDSLSFNGGALVTMTRGLGLFRFSSAGSIVWSKKLADTGSTRRGSLSVSGNTAHIFGAFTDQLTLAPNTTATTPSAFRASLTL